MFLPVCMLNIPETFILVCKNFSLVFISYASVHLKSIYKFWTVKVLLGFYPTEIMLQMVITVRGISWGV